MKIFINLTSIILFSFSIIACNAESDKANLTSVNKIPPLLNQTYAIGELDTDDSFSRVQFDDKGNFIIDAVWKTVLDGPRIDEHPCKIQGEVTLLPNEIILLTNKSFENRFGDLEVLNINSTMILKIINEKEIEIAATSEIVELCGHSEFIGKYKKIG